MFGSPLVGSRPRGPRSIKGTLTRERRSVPGVPHAVERVTHAVVVEQAAASFSVAGAGGAKESK